MAIVYQVRDQWTKERRALKLLLPHAARSKKTRTRFLHEARTMKVLDHPHVIRILDVGEEDGHFYFVMERAQGGSLAHYLRRHGARSPRESLTYTHQVLRGLDFAHRAGVVHRDIKPHNMLLSDPPDPEAGTGDGCTIKLTDFGIARVLTSQGSRLTGTGDTLGTLAYMSPEQRLDPRKAGPAADIYGVGATLYILVTGRRPFDLAMTGVDPTILERLPDAVRPIVVRSTAKLPGGRYATCADMAHDVSRGLELLGPLDGRASAPLPWDDVDDDTIVTAGDMPD